MTNTIVDTLAIAAANKVVAELMKKFPVENTTTFPYTACESCNNFTPENEDFPAKCTKNPCTASLDCPRLAWLQYQASQSMDALYPDPEGEEIPF